jgi:acyl-CoA dehydrogenase
MEFSWTQEQLMIQKTLKEFGKKEIIPRRIELELKSKIPGPLIKGLAKLGLLGMTVAKDYGGSAAPPLTTGIVAEELARADISCAIPTFFLVQAAWGHILNKYGTPEAKHAILPAVTTGRAFLGIAATEPEAGSDLANMTTIATPTPGGYDLHGEKTYISGINEATQQLPEGGGHLTLAKTDLAKGTRGISLFLVPLKNTPGLTANLLEDWGRKGISSGGFVMDHIQVPAEFMVGSINRGFYLAMEGFDYARALISVVCCGAAMSALEYAMDYIKQRQVFGQPIGRFEGVQGKLARHWAQLEAIRLLGYHALWQYEQEQVADACDRFTVTRECAEAKLLAPVAAFEAINDAIQWFGAFGYTVECPLYQALLGVRSYYWAEGAREIMGIIVARELLGKDYVAYR